MTGAEMTGIRRVFWWYENEGKYDWWEYGLVRKKCLGKHYFTTTVCKAWALTNCHRFSTHERMFLTEHSRTRHSSFLCHAGLLGILRKIYESLGHSCEPNHITNLKATLPQLAASVSMSQSMMHVLNGKLVYDNQTESTFTGSQNY